MAKILLVEDDNNLREIYEARLQAEGYEILSARDGEEALVVAKAEKPDLVISDIMMPKISGFEMLDILRNTEGLKDVKVIMLTALGQTDDQQRADKLGADRYLVKSQVTLEDIAKAAHDLLGDATAAASQTTPQTPAPTATQTADDQVMHDAVDSLVADTEKAADQSQTGQAPEQTPTVNKKIIQPLGQKPAKDIQTLLAEEEAKESQTAGQPDAQIENFVAGASTAPTPPVTPAPTAAPSAPAAPAPDTTPAPAPDTTPAPAPSEPNTPPSDKPSTPDPNIIAL